MNTNRIAELHAELARIHAELAAEYGASPAANDHVAPPKRARKPPVLTRPDGEATPIVAAQAARILRDRGFRS